MEAKSHFCLLLDIKNLEINLEYGEEESLSLSIQSITKEKNYNTKMKPMIRLNMIQTVPLQSNLKQMRISSM